MSRQPSPELSTVLGRLEGVERSGESFVARCPAHKDRNPSLSISDGDTRVLLTCHANCAFENIVSELGMTPADLIHARHRDDDRSRGQSRTAATPSKSSALAMRASGKPKKPRDYGEHEAYYHYEDENGRPLFRVDRRRLSDGSKDFFQHGFDGAKYIRKMTLPDGSKVRRVLYRLPAVREACIAGRVVFIVEGEKDVHTLETLGLTATTSPQGAGKWQDDFAESLKGAACVAILPDNDTTGAEHARDVARSCAAAGLPVRIVRLPGLPDKGDATDWVEAGGTEEQLRELVKATPPFVLGERVDDRAPAKADKPRAALSDLGFVCLDDVESEAVDWLWTDWIPRGMLSLCDGRPDAGKTTMLCDLAARVTKGQAMPTEDFVPAGREPGSVLFVTSENAFAQVLRPRLEAAGADLKRCHGWQWTPDKDGLPDCPRFPRDADVLAAAARELGASLIVVDPLFSHMDAGANPNRETDVRRALVPLARIAEESGAAVVVVRHFNKSANGDAINAGGGSIGIVGTARVQLIVGKPPEEPDESPGRVLAVGKMNIAPKPQSRAFSITSADSDGVATSRVLWGGVSTSTAADLTRSRGFDGQSAAPVRSEVEDWMADALEGGPRLAREMWQEAEQLGYAERTVKRAKRKLGVDALRKGFGEEGGWYWLLPSESTPEDAPSNPAEEGGPLWEDAPDTRSKGATGNVDSEQWTKGGQGAKGTPAHVRAREPSGDGLPDGDLAVFPIDDVDDEVADA